MLELFNQYQTEIIAALALLVVVIFLFIVIQKKQNKPQVVEDAYDTPQEEETVEESTTAEQQEVETIQTTPKVQEDTQKERQETTPQKVETSIQQTKSKAHRREVPPHAKINKEDFKEFEGKRILLAEDNLINQKVILGLLADSGIEIVVADDGQIALDILEKDKNFMVILMDAHMPRVDGFEATRKIRANSAYDYIPVIALSGDTAADDIKKMLDAGMEDHLEKPLKMDALYDVLYTYSANEQTPEIEEAVNSTELMVLDKEDGVKICGGDTSFYAEILKEFVIDFRDSSKKLQAFINERKLQEADKLLLDVIGVSANIGARELQERAKELKVALSDGNELKAKFLTYHESLKNLLEAIQKHLQK